MPKEFGFTPKNFVTTPVAQERGSRAFVREATSQFVIHAGDVFVASDGGETLRKQLTPQVEFILYRNQGGPTTDKLHLDVYVDANDPADHKNYLYTLFPLGIVRRRELIGPDALFPPPKMKSNKNFSLPKATDEGLEIFLDDPILGGTFRNMQDEIRAIPDQQQQLEEILRAHRAQTDNVRYEEKLGLNNGPVGAPEIVTLFEYVKQAPLTELKFPAS